MVLPMARYRGRAPRDPQGTQGPSKSTPCPVPRCRSPLAAHRGCGGSKGCGFNPAVLEARVLGAVLCRTRPVLLGTPQHLPAPCAQVEAGHPQVLGGFRPARLPLRSFQGLHLIALAPANLLMGSIFRGFDNNRKVSPTPGGRQMGRSGKQLWGWGKQLWGWRKQFWGWGKQPWDWGLGLPNMQARAGGSEDQSEFRILPARWPAPSSL